MPAPPLPLSFPKLLDSYVLLVALLVCVPPALATSTDSLTLRITNEKGQLLREALVYDHAYNILAQANAEGLYHLSTDLTDLDSIVVTSFGYSSKRLFYPTLVKQKHHEIRLAFLSDALDEILIVGRFDQSKQEQNHLVQSIASAEFTHTQSATTADVLEQHSDVFVQKSQFGGGSPVIRGFEASRVLLVVDGVRMNNLIYRSGHLQNAITIDPAALSQMEIIYGPGSLLYGSDALGGVIHFRTQDPTLRFKEQKSVSGGAAIRYASAANAVTGHFDLNIGGSKMAYCGSITFADYGDVKAGSKFSSTYPDFGKRPFFVETDSDGDRIVQNDDVYRQVGTGYRQFDMIHKFKWQPTKNYAQTINVQYSTSSDIPRYDQLTEIEESPMDLRFAEWHYGPQKRLLVSSKNVITNTSIFDKGVIIGAMQRIDESRISRRINRTEQINQLEEVTVLSLTGDFQKSAFGEKIDFLYGFDLNYNSLTSTAFSRDIHSNLKSNTLTRYPDGLARLSSWGVYLNARKTLAEGWTANLGSRFSGIQTHLKYDGGGLIEWPEPYLAGIKNQNGNLTWAGSINYSDDEWGLRFLVGSAFRAPNIDDLAKIRVKGGEASVPNVDLLAERAINVELTASHKFENSGQASLTGFYTHLEDAIVQAPFSLPDGQTQLAFDGELFTTLANINAARGNIYGISINLSYPLADDWQFTSSFNYIKGTSISIDDAESPMAHIPPIYGRTTVSYSPKRLNIETVLRYNGAKKRKDYSTNSADNLDKATAEGTLAWVTVSLYSTYQLTEDFQLQLALENITDRHYRPFASGVSAPGRNVAASLRWLF